MVTDTYEPVFSPEEEMRIEEEYKALLDIYLASNHRKKVEIINRAFTLARLAHGGVRRRSGEPYILHPISVARIICEEMGLGSTSICCALLHDVVEDTEYTVEDIRIRFGDNIARIVDGLTKISGENFQATESIQAENYRKLLLTMSNDARVILIKIADRLHNMRTLGSMLPAKQYKIIGETLYVYAPLAHRFGLFSIKTELEDLSFRYEQPDRYAYISEKVAASEAGRQDLFERFSAPIISSLLKKGIVFDIKTRTKSNYSIWRKMQEKGVPFEEVYDLFAVRIVFDSSDGYPEKNRCWDIYTAITDIYRTHPDRLRDWLSNPKANGYQALHSTFMGPDGRWIEVQIRSKRMDDIAEQGVAAHWRYKGTQVEEDRELEQWLDTIREVLQVPTPSAMDFLDNLKLSLNTQDILVFTPKGRSLSLPANATVLDFAYAIHSDLGDRCIGAKVNHHVKPISTRLNTGDQVEILDSQSTRPAKEWLEFVATARAKYKIEEALRRQRREGTQRGEEMVTELFHDRGDTVTASKIDRLSHSYGYEKKDDFFHAVGVGEVNLDEDTRLIMKDEPEAPNYISRFLSLFGVKNQSTTAARKAAKAKRQTNEPTSSGVIDRKSTYILEETEGRLNYRVALCCHPIPGDDVLGIVSDKNIVEVHDKSCQRAMRIKSSQGDRLVSTEWGEHHESLFEATLSVKGVDSAGILHSITQTLLEEFKVNITSINICAKDGIFEGHVTLMVHQLSELDRISQVLLRNNRSLMMVSRVHGTAQLMS